jgi:hypothetical protein
MYSEIPPPSKKFRFSENRGCPARKFGAIESGQVFGWMPSNKIGSASSTKNEGKTLDTSSARRRGARFTDFWLRAFSPILGL